MSTTPIPAPAPAPAAQPVVSPAPVAAPAPTVKPSTLAVTILNDALAAGMIAISLFVKNPATQQHAATLITAFTPLLGMIEQQLGISTTNPAA